MENVPTDIHPIDESRGFLRVSRSLNETKTLFNQAEQEEIDNWEKEKQKSSRKLLSNYRTIEKFKKLKKQNTGE